MAHRFAYPSPLPRKPSSSREVEHGSDSATVMFPEVQAEESTASTPQLVEDDPIVLGLSTEHLHTAARQYERARSPRQRQSRLCDRAVVEMHQIQSGEHRVSAVVAGGEPGPRSAAPRRRLVRFADRVDNVRPRQLRQARRTISQGAGGRRRSAGPRSQRHKDPDGDCRSRRGTGSGPPGDVDVRRHPPTESTLSAGLSRPGLGLRKTAAIQRRHRRLGRAGKASPNDADATRKINDLAAAETIARGNYRR